jgi:phosphohistidine phosphatase
MGLIRSLILPQIGQHNRPKVEISYMRRLLLLRHAKASPLSGKGDRERPLNGRGKEDAARIGQYLETEGLIPDAALVSDSRRTRETLDLVLRAVRRRLPFFVAPELYGATDSEILEAVRITSKDIASLLVVGHNPGIAELAVDLLGSGGSADRARLKTKFPTSALAIVDFGVEDWSDVALRRGRLDRFVTPASLGGSDD